LAYNEAASIIKVEAAFVSAGPIEPVRSFTHQRRYWPDPQTTVARVPDPNLL